MVMLQFDPRSEKNIQTLVPKAQAKARAFLQGVRDAGINAKIIDGSRTFEEQDALFAIGRTKPGHVVTNARGGFSNHNFGSPGILEFSMGPSLLLNRHSMIKLERLVRAWGWNG